VRAGDRLARGTTRRQQALAATRDLDREMTL
jgi:hypothetical protein